MKRSVILFIYIILDFISAIGAWCTFYFLTLSSASNEKLTFAEILTPDFVYQLAFVTSFWILIYLVTGFYSNGYRRSRINEFFQTAGQVLLGGLILFFILFLGNNVGSAHNYYYTFGTLLGVQFAFTYFPRLIITSFIIIQIRNRRLGFKTIIVGDGVEAEALYAEITGFKAPQGHLFVGFVATSAKESKLANHIPCLGPLSDLSEIIDSAGAEEVIIALSHKETLRIQRVINDLYGKKVQVKVIPSLYDFLTGKVKMSSIMGTPLILVNHRLMPAWQELLKLIIDFVVSLTTVVLLLP